MLWEVEFSVVPPLQRDAEVDTGVVPVVIPVVDSRTAVCGIYPPLIGGFSDSAPGCSYSVGSPPLFL